MIPSTQRFAEGDKKNREKVYVSCWICNKWWWLLLTKLEFLYCKLYLNNPVFRFVNQIICFNSQSTHTLIDLFLKISNNEPHLYLNAYTHLNLNVVLPVLRRWYSLSITGQSSFFFYGVDRNEQVTWLHPPSWTMVWSTVQTICRTNSNSLSIKTEKSDSSASIISRS